MDPRGRVPRGLGVSFGAAFSRSGGHSTRGWLNTQGALGAVIGLIPGVILWQFDWDVRIAIDDPVKCAPLEGNRHVHPHRRLPPRPVRRKPHRTSNNKHRFGNEHRPPGLSDNARHIEPNGTAHAERGVSTRPYRHICASRGAVPRGGD